MNLIGIDYSIDIPLWKHFRRRMALLISLYFASQAAFSQASLIDSIWQSLPSSDSISQVERFFSHLQKNQKQLKTSDITYAINLGMGSLNGKRTPQNLMTWHKLAGDLYQPDVTMRLNALFHYNQALAYAERLQAIQHQVEITIKIADLYRELHVPEKAYFYGKKAETWCRNKKLASKIPHISDYLKEIAYFYVIAGKRFAANACFSMASKERRFSDVLIEIYNYNNWGINATALSKYAEALQIFEKGIALAQRHQQEIWVGIIKGNQGTVYRKLGQLDRANALIEYDLKASTDFGDCGNAARAAQYLAEIALEQNNPQRAQHFIQQSADLFPMQAEGEGSKMEYLVRQLRIRSAYYVLTKEWQQAYVFRVKAENLLDTIAQRESIQEKRRLKDLIQYMEMESESQRKVEQAVFEKQQTEKHFLLALIVFTLIFGTGLWAFRRAQQRNYKNEQALSTKLQESSFELSNYRTQLREKSKQVEHLKTIIGKAPELNKEKIPNSSYATLTQFTILTESDWRNFKSLFDEVHEGFIEKLAAHKANFTPAEIRLLALLKLGLQSSEIADSLGISLNGVKKGRQRLRKKLADWPEEKALLELLP